MPVAITSGYVTAGRRTGQSEPNGDRPSPKASSTVQAYGVRTPTDQERRPASVPMPESSHPVSGKGTDAGRAGPRCQVGAGEVAPRRGEFRSAEPVLVADGQVPHLVTGVHDAGPGLRSGHSSHTTGSEASASGSP